MDHESCRGGSPRLLLHLSGLLGLGGRNTVVPSDKMLILIAKTGKEMPTGQMIAEPGQKGVLLEPLGPGRHFVNPFLYERDLRDQIVINGGEIGVVITKFGKELPAGEFLAGPGQRGIQREVLLPGTYRLNRMPTKSAWKK